jgi:hypothetical protein
MLPPAEGTHIPGSGLGVEQMRQAPDSQPLNGEPHGTEVIYGDHEAV